MKNLDYLLVLESKEIEVIRDALKEVASNTFCGKDKIINYMNEIVYYNFDHMFNTTDDDRLYRNFKRYEEIFQEDYMVDLVDSTYTKAINMGLWCNTKEWKAFQAQKLDNPYDVYHFGMYDKCSNRKVYLTDLSKFSGYCLTLRAFAVFSIVMHIIYDNLSRITMPHIFALLDHVISEFEKQLRTEPYGGNIL